MPPQDIAPFQAMSQVPNPTPSPGLKMGKFKASKMIVKESWALLQQDKEILWFPVLSTISSLLALVIMGVLFFFLVMGGDINAFEGETEQKAGALEYILALVYYTVMFFIINFFQAGMFIIAHGRMNGLDLTFSDGIHGAQEVAGKIFLWSLISATVGVILRLIAERSKLIGRIVVALLGAAWNILTYFSLLSLVIGKVSVLDSFKMSADTIRKTWGETIIITIGTGLFFMLVLFTGLALGIVIMILVPTMVVFVAVGGLLLAFILAIGIISTSLEAIFKLALFEYARTGIVPKGFSPELIQNAVKK
jgi:hypothetical protein